MSFTLNASPRTERGKQLNVMRQAGKLPAIVYGPQQVATPLTLDRIQFEKVFKKAGESSIISLSGIAGVSDVLVQDVAFDPGFGGIVHVDFYAIEAGKEITVEVPLVFVGEAPALKLGGTLTKVLHEVSVTCAPSALPKEIVVDVSTLVDFEIQIHASDLSLPPNVTLENDPEEVVALVQEVKEEVETPTVVDMSAIEVEKKGKVESTEE